MTSSSFADAQRRVLERQARREAESRAQPSPRSSSSNAASGRLSSTSAHLLSRITSREGTRPPFRVGQVDAELLDEELLTLLKDQVGEALKYYGASLREDYGSEILLALRAVLFKLSIWDHDASYGATLQGLKYSNARSTVSSASPPTKLQKTAYGLLTVFGRYGWEKWEEYLTANAGGDQYSYTQQAPSPRSQLFERLSRFSSIASTAHSIAAFVSFLAFLVNGRYRTLTDRLLRLRLVPASSQVSREVSFEYLNRQLVWHAFTEFLLFLLPLVGIGRWRRWISRGWRRAKLAVKKSTQDPNADDAEDEKSGPLAHLPERTCAICYADQNPELSSEAELLGTNTGAGGGGGVVGSVSTDIVNAYEAIPCGCIYDFACLATKIESEEGEGWACLRCGEIINQCKPWDGDVVPPLPPTNARSGKRVGFEDEQVQQLETEGLTPSEPISEAPSRRDSQLQDSTQWSEVGQEASSEDEFEEEREDDSGGDEGYEYR